MWPLNSTELQKDTQISELRKLKQFVYALFTYDHEKKQLT